jgi:hypothetical protein
MAGAVEPARRRVRVHGKGMASVEIGARRRPAQGQPPERHPRRPARGRHTLYDHFCTRLREAGLTVATVPPHQRRPGHHLARQRGVVTAFDPKRLARRR